MQSKRDLLLEVASFTPEQIKYLILCLPEIKQCLDLMVASEKKYGEGLTCSEKDSSKAIGHILKGLDGEINPDDGSNGSNYVAATVRAIKLMKFEKIIKEARD